MEFACDDCACTEGGGGRRREAAGGGGRRREAAGGGGRRRLATASASPMRPTQKRSVACAIGRIMKLTTAGSASEAIRLSSSSPKRQAACGGGGVPSAASSGAVDLSTHAPWEASSAGTVTRAARRGPRHMGIVGALRARQGDV